MKKLFYFMLIVALTFLVSGSINFKQVEGGKSPPEKVKEIFQHQTTVLTDFQFQIDKQTVEKQNVIKDKILKNIFITKAPDSIKGLFGKSFIKIYDQKFAGFNYYKRIRFNKNKTRNRFNFNNVGFSSGGLSC